jgi:serine/threonine protein kinase
MTALRHPNVVLFMAASTKAPKMCIVMEFMALGSLFDVCALPPSFISMSESLLDSRGVCVFVCVTVAA